MARTVQQFLSYVITEGLSDSQYQANKKHHGNTKLELESAPHKVGKMPYRGPVKKVPTVKEDNSEKVASVLKHNKFSKTAGKYRGLDGDTEYNIWHKPGKGSVLVGKKGDWYKQYSQIGKDEPLSSREGKNPSKLHKAVSSEDFSLKPQSQDDLAARNVYSDRNIEILEKASKL